MISDFFTEHYVYIKSTYNNTIITLTNKKGDTLIWCSAGMVSSTKNKRSTTYGAQLAAEKVAAAAVNRSIDRVQIKVQGFGNGREVAIRSLQNKGLIITLIHDITPIPHNGCRPSKRRRV